MNRSLTVAIDGDVSGLDRATAQGLRDLGNLARASVQAGAQLAAGIEKGTGRARDALGRYSSSAASAAQRVGGSQGGVNRSLLTTAGIYNQLSGLAVKAFAVERVLAFGQAVGVTSGKFERFEAVLTNALGSRSGAKDSLSALTDFAGDNPAFKLDELTGAFVKFVNRGIVPTKAQLTNFGDLAASQGKGFDQLTEAILDAQTGEFERLKEFGIRASKSGDQVTLSFKGVSQTVKATAGSITEAIQKFGQLSGVSGSMASISQTQEGQATSLATAYDKLLVAIGNRGVAGGMKLAMSAGQELLGTLTNLISNSPAEEFRRQQSELNGLVGAIALANNNEQVRLSLITQLNQQYPEFLGRLNAESVTTDLLTTRLAAYNAQYERKIRIALGEEKIKRAQETVTAAIRQQSDALQILAKESGKALTELEKLTPAQQLSLAKDISQKKQGSTAELNIFGVRAQTAYDYLPGVMAGATAAQAKAQAELNRLTGENATRQADLTKTTVEGYQQEIAQLREKIKLKQIDRAEGQADIKRLQGLINTTKGIAPKVDMTPIGVGGKSKSGKTSAEEYSRLAVNQRIADVLEREIQNADGRNVDEKINQLRIVREEIQRIQSLSGKEQPAGITGIQQLADPAFNEKLRGALMSFVQIAGITPELFQNTNVNDFLSQLEKGAPTLEFYNNQIGALKALVATLALNGIAIPDKVIRSLETLKAAVKDAEDTANKIDQKTTPGGTGDSDMSGWEDKASAKIARLKAMGIEINATKEEVAQAMKSLAQEWVKGGSSMFQAMGEAFAKGEDPLKAALKSITDTIGNFLIQQGEALAMAAIFATAASAVAGPFAALLALPTAGAIAAAGIMIAGGAAIKTLGATALEGGGLATGPTLAYIGESAKARAGGGELVTSVDQGTRLIAKGLIGMGAVQANAMPSARTMTPNAAGGMSVNLGGEFTLRGNDLYLSIYRAIESQMVYGTRPRGQNPFKY